MQVRKHNTATAVRASLTQSHYLLFSLLNTLFSAQIILSTNCKTANFFSAPLIFPCFRAYNSIFTACKLIQQLKYSIVTLLAVVRKCMHRDRKSGGNVGQGMCEHLSISLQAQKRLNSSCSGDDGAIETQLTSTVSEFRIVSLGIVCTCQ